MSQTCISAEKCSDAWTQCVGEEDADNSGKLCRKDGRWDLLSLQITFVAIERESGGMTLVNTSGPPLWPNAVRKEPGQQSVNREPDRNMHQQSCENAVDSAGRK